MKTEKYILVLWKMKKTNPSAKEFLKIESFFKLAEFNM
jgi:hypothetical protein